MRKRSTYTSILITGESDIHFFKKNLYVLAQRSVLLTYHLFICLNLHVFLFVSMFVCLWAYRIYNKIFGQKVLIFFLLLSLFIFIYHSLYIIFADIFNVLVLVTLKFSVKNFLSKCDLIRCFLRIWLHLLKNSLIENFIFCAV